MCFLTLNHSLALLIKRPYETSAGNAFYIFSACKRVFSSVCLLVFWGGFRVPVSTQTFISLFVILSTDLLILILVDWFKQTDIKRNLGIVLIVAETAYAIALFVTLLLNGGEPSSISNKANGSFDYYFLFIFTPIINNRSGNREMEHWTQGTETSFCRHWGDDEPRCAASVCLFSHFKPHTE